MINPKTFRRLLGVLTSLLFVILLSQIVGGFSNQSAESKGELNNLLPISNQPLQIGGVLSADVVEIGEIVTLTMAVRNNQTDAATPKLTIQLPPSLQLEMSKLGDNMLFNPKEQTLYWYPELNQSGDMAVQDVSLIALRPTKNSEDVGAILLQISDKQDGFTNQLDLPIWVGHSIKPAALFEVTDQAGGSRSNNSIHQSKCRSTTTHIRLGFWGWTDNNGGRTDPHLCCARELYRHLKCYWEARGGKLHVADSGRYCSPD